MHARPWQTLRALRRRPTFAAVVLVTFALGLGATTAITSVVHHVLLRPLPYPEPGRLVQVWTEMPDAGIAQLPAAHAEYLDLRQESRLLVDAGAYYSRPVILTGSGEPERVVATQATASLWAVLGIPVARGRALAPGDEVAGAEPVAVLGHGLWQSRLGGDPGVVGRSLEVDGVTRRVIGVMPLGFAFPDSSTQLWLPIVLDPTHRKNHHLTVLARLRDGVTCDQLQSGLDAMVARWATLYDHSHPFLAVPYQEQLLGTVRRPLELLFGAVLLVLLVAAVNVAGLMLARGEALERELAVRAALGCGRLGLARGLVGECLVLALLGGLLGLGLAEVAVKLLLALQPGGLPRIDQVRLDLPVVLASFALSLLAGLVAGLVPALRASRPDVAAALRGGGGRGIVTPARQRTRSVLVIAETTVAVVLVASAALLLRGLWALQRVDPGLDPERVLTAYVSLPAATYPGAAEVTGFYDRLLEGLRGLPGVQAASLVNSLPMRDTIRLILVSSAWQPPGAEPFGADVTMVSPAFFATLGTPLLRGRAFTDDDRPGTARVAAVNQTAARALFGDREPLGERLEIVQADPQAGFEVVGLVRDVQNLGLGSKPRPQVYLPLAQAVSEIRGVTRAVSVAVKTEVAPASLAPALRKAVWELDAGLAVSNLETMDTVVAASVAPQRFQAVLVVLFALLALVLAAVGLYGLLAHLVGQRRRELGVRLALGARPGRLVRLVVLQGLFLAALGVTLGLVLAVAIGRLLGGIAAGIDGSDPLTLTVTVALFLATAAVASLVPARRAARIDPAETLRDG